MKPHHLLSQMLVLAAAFSALALAGRGYEVDWPDPLAIVTMGTALGQIALAAAWVAWGRWNLALRTGLLLAVVFGWHYPVAKCTGVVTGNYGWWIGLLLLYALSNLALFVLARLGGLKMFLGGQSLKANSGKKWWQFTLGGALTLTTLVAMFLGIARQLDFPWREVVGASSFCLLAGVGSAAGVIVALAAKPAWLAAIGPLAVCALVGFLLRYTGLPPQPYEALVWMAAVLGGVIAIAAAVLRVAGYRLERNAEVLPSPE